MHPTILRVGSVELHSYGLLLAIAFLVGIQLFLSRGAKRGLPEEKLSTLSLLLLVLA
ncbi:MAG: prolipoprotein diacylglyceryl transferase, partial [Candidatus Latescibacteria bacterium]|nr:prolipoprotein diacylglyceryl transferase [Candidatus Latescibacterota bacterium]